MLCYFDIPAHAGIQTGSKLHGHEDWIPICTGMTIAYGSDVAILRISPDLQTNSFQQNLGQLFLQRGVFLLKHLVEFFWILQLELVGLHVFR